MKKKILSLLFCLVMVLSLMPTAAFAATAYDVWVDGKQFSDDNLTITCGSGTASYDPNTKTLTLNNATITQTNNASSSGAIYADDDLTVNVASDSTITLGAYTNGDGIYVNGNLTITGDAALNITTAYEYSDCVWANNGDLTVDMKGALTIKSASTGLSATGDVTVSGSGNVTIDTAYYGVYSSGADVMLSGSGDVNFTTYDDGIYAQTGNVTLSGSGDVTIDSGNDGIYAEVDATVSGSGDVTIDSGNDGIYAEVDVTFSGNGNVTINSDECGIYSNNGALTISGIGDVMITAGDEFGVDVFDNVTLSGSGKVTVISEGNAAVGLYESGKKVLLNGTGSPITLKAAEGCKAVLFTGGNDNPGEVMLKFYSSPDALKAVADDNAAPNSGTDESLVGGTNIAYYNKVTGDPDTGLVIYEHVDCYTVTFDANGHGTAPAKQTVVSGNTAAKPEDLSAEGYTFGGWYADAACKVAFDFNSAITADTTVYAKWSEVKANAPTEPTDPTDFTSPDTGDNSHMILWFVLLFSSSALVVTSVYGKRKRAK